MATLLTIHIFTELLTDRPSVVELNTGNTTPTKSLAFDYELDNLNLSLAKTEDCLKDPINKF